MSRRGVSAAALLALVALSGCAGDDGEPLALCTAGDVVLTIEQTANAATIAVVGKRLGMPNHAVTVALATAFQESGLRNLDHGDRDSLGLFQQRPSQGWGSAEVVSTPRLAAASFYRRLARVPGWATLPVTEAAQAVQRSAAPEAYAQWEHTARELARALTGEVPHGLACQFVPAAERTADPAAAIALRRAAVAELGPGGLARGAAAPAVAGASPAATASPAAWTTASWLVAHASEYGVTRVSLSGQAWTAERGTWEDDPEATDLSWS